jgi:hypothetical protein
MSFEDSTYWTAAVVSGYIADADAISACTTADSFDGGCIGDDNGVDSQSEDKKDGNAYGWTLLIYNGGSGGVDIWGGSDNAITTAASAFTLAGVAGLFF